MVFYCIFYYVFFRHIHFHNFYKSEFYFLNENNLLIFINFRCCFNIFSNLLKRETSKLFSQYYTKKTGSKTSLNYVLQFSLFAFIPSLIVAFFSLILFNVALQKYFDQKITSAVNNSYEVAKNYIEESKRNVEADIFLNWFRFK